VTSIDVFEEHAEEYDRWFDKNAPVYQAQVDALSRLIPSQGLGIEAGAGTGRFSVPFGIRLEVEPAAGMAEYARKRGIRVCQALGQQLPPPHGRFDFDLVTVVCFVKQVPDLLPEIHRVLKRGGRAVLVFIDRNSFLGRIYQSEKETNKFHREEHFYSAEQILRWLQQAGFAEPQVPQTIFGVPGGSSATEQGRDGFGQGAFVALCAKK
jgi:SAM-dependent methyltransferase